MAQAEVDTFGEFAVIKGDDGRIYFLRRGWDRPQDITTIHSAAFQGVERPFVMHDAGDYPYETLRHYLYLCYRRTLALMLMQNVLDLELDVTLRNDCMKSLKDFFESEEVWKIVEEGISYIQLPEKISFSSAPKKGRLGKLFGAVKALSLSRTKIPSTQ